MKLDTLLRRSLLPGLFCSATLAAHAQNVGVGTLTPSEKLDVVGGNLKLSTSGSRLIFPDGTAQSTAASGTGFILNGTAPQAGSNFNISGNGYLGGRLGIGTSGPAGQLANTANNVIATDGNGISQQGLGWVNTSAVGYAGVFYNANNAASGPGLAVKVASTGAAALDVSQGSNIGLAGTSLLRVQGNGNVGIGTSSPTQKLDVTGNANVSGSSYVGGSVGIGTTSPTQALDVSGGILARNYSTISTQGAYLQWNRSGGLGETWLLNQKGGGSGGIFFGASDAVSSGTNAITEWARFDSNGNLGLGTTTPGHPLTVRAGAASNSPLLGFYSQAGTDVFNFSLADGGLNLSESGVAGGRLFVKPGGNIGIGTTNPIAPLHVKGGAPTLVASGSASFFNPGGGFNAIGNMSGNKNTTAYFEGGEVWVSSYLVAGTLNTTSDRRIKHVIGLSDRATDLALLNKLRITNYTYIDQVNNTPGVVKKVIAQEVEEVLPTAVSRSTQALPNVYERATKLGYANGQLTVTTAKPHELPATGGRMRFYTPANESLDPEVTVVDAHTVRFACADAHAAGLFVYGKYVSDFRSVDYDALTTLNVSATQELACKVAALEKQNAALQGEASAAKAEAAAAKTQAAQVTATLDTFEARLRRLEAGGAQAQR